jgi:lipopolysaccharide export system protein LptA
MNSHPFLFLARRPFLLLMLVVLLCGSAVLAQTTITSGDMTITSRLMTFANNIYVARGGITAVQKETTMTADRGIYDRNLEIVKAIDNVKVVQPGSVLTSDYLEAYVKEDRILAKGNPRRERIVERESRDESGELKKKKSRVILTCNEVEGFNKENRFLAKGDVHVIEVPFREGETEEEALENEKDPDSDLTCETLELFSLEDKAIARTNVVIITRTLRATGDRAIYLDRENRLIIVGHAHAWQTSREAPGAEEQVSELYANKIIYYPNEDRTIAVGEVHATVYPKGQKGPEEDSKTKREKRRKKKQAEEGSDEPEGNSEESTPARRATGEGPDRQRAPTSATERPKDLPAGDYTAIGDESVIEATSE